jgi:signal transduction histidine kinase
MARSTSLPHGWTGAAIAKTAPPRRLRPSTARGIALLIVAVTISAPMAHASDWRPIWVLLALVAMNVVGETFTATIGGVHVSPNDVFVALAVIVLGPFPAMVVCASGLVVDKVMRGIPLRTLFTNVAAAALVCGAASLTLALGREVGWGTPGTGTFLLTVLGVVIVQDLIGLLAVWLTNDRGLRVASNDVRAAHTMILPWVVVSAGITAGATHAYYTVGSAVIFVLGGTQIALAIVLRQLGQSDQLRGELAAVQAEQERLAAELLAAERASRHRLAAALHDDALQTLLAARQDLEEIEGVIDEKWTRAQRRLDSGLTTLRRLIAGRLLTPPGDDTALADRLEAVVQRLLERGVNVSVSVDARPPSHLEAVLLQIGSELATNVARHAHARAFRLAITQEDDQVVLTAQDDGRGFRAEQLPRRLAEGHLGLGLVRERVAQLGGTLEIDSIRGGGTRVEAHLPAS